MGFLDKAKENLERVAKQGQDKIDEVQSKKKADGLLRDLGAWTYAAHTGRDGGKGPTEAQRIIAELQAHEAEHGPLGEDHDDAETQPPTMTPPPPPSAGGPPIMTPPPPPSTGGAPIITPPPPPPPMTAPMTPPAPPTGVAPPLGSEPLAPEAGSPAADL